VARPRSVRATAAWSFDMERGDNITNQSCDASVVTKSCFLRETKPNHNEAFRWHDDDELTEATIGEEGTWRQKGLLPVAPCRCKARLPARTIAIRGVGGG
jgi:hypothetical protein